MSCSVVSAIEIPELGVKRPEVQILSARPEVSRWNPAVTKRPGLLFLRGLGRSDARSGLLAGCDLVDKRRELRGHVQFVEASLPSSLRCER